MFLLVFSDITHVKCGQIKCIAKDCPAHRASEWVISSYGVCASLLFMYRGGSSIIVQSDAVAKQLPEGNTLWGRWSKNTSHHWSVGAPAVHSWKKKKNQFKSNADITHVPAAVGTGFGLTHRRGDVMHLQELKNHDFTINRVVRESRTYSFNIRSRKRII